MKCESTLNYSSITYSGRRSTPASCYLIDALSSLEAPRRTYACVCVCVWVSTPRSRTTCVCVFWITFRPCSCPSSKLERYRRGIQVRMRSRQLLYLNGQHRVVLFLESARGSIESLQDMRNHRETLVPSTSSTLTEFSLSYECGYTIWNTPDDKGDDVEGRRGRRKRRRRRRRWWWWWRL